MFEEIITLFEHNLNDTYYSELYGFSKNITTYRKFNHLCAKIFFKVLDNINLDYYTFAGTSIGYIRNKQNIPWVDDFDIMIFEEEIPTFVNIVLPKLTEFGFYCTQINVDLGCAGFFVLSQFGQKCFQCDVFFSKIDENGIVKNVANFGLYSDKNIHIDLVKPKQYLTIDDDLTIPFFNNMEQDINIEYGDVFNTVIFHVNHNISLILNNTPFYTAYDTFNKIKTQIVTNTMALVNDHKYENNETLFDYDIFCKHNFCEQNNVLNVIIFLKYIKQNNIQTLNIFDEKFLEFCPDVQLYFKNININFYMTTNIDMKYFILLNYVDHIFCSSKQNIDYVENYNEQLVKHKPTIDYIRVITFGTFDLFHIGHVNILKRAKKYGELTIGISTDELNFKKGKTSVNKLKQRKNDVNKSGYVDLIFDEESLELKNDYVKKYNCNLLIIGDDWKNAFNYCDCACLYLERTPNISTTMLKGELPDDV